jgi:ankyrin repeat protein
MEYDPTLRIYCESGDFTKVVDYLRYHTVPQSTLDDCVINSVHAGNIQIIDILASYGADVHVCNETPLCKAIEYKQMQIVIYLLENGADLSENNRCIKLAIQNKFNDFIKVCIEYIPNIVAIINKQHLLVEAILFNNLNCIKYFIEIGALVDPICPYLAIAGSYYDVLVYLLNNGAHLEQSVYNKEIKNKNLYKLSDKIISVLTEMSINP